MKRIHLVNGMILAFSVILIRYLDVHIYDMNLIVTLILLIALIVGLMKVVERIPSLDKSVSRRAGMIINTLVVMTIFLAFFVLKL